MVTRAQWGVLEGTFRLLSLLCRGWVVLAAAIILASPVGPHLRIDDVYGRHCTYLGSRGIVQVRSVPGCPMLIWHDRREVRS